MQLIKRISDYYTRMFHKYEWNKMDYNTYYDNEKEITQFVEENFDFVDYYIEKELSRLTIFLRYQEDLNLLKVVHPLAGIPIHNGVYTSNILPAGAIVSSNGLFYLNTSAGVVSGGCVHNGQFINIPHNQLANYPNLIQCIPGPSSTVTVANQSQIPPAPSNNPFSDPFSFLGDI